MSEKNLRLTNSRILARGFILPPQYRDNALDPQSKAAGWSRPTAQLFHQAVIAPAAAQGALRPAWRDVAIFIQLKYGIGIIIQAAHQSGAQHIWHLKFIQVFQHLNKKIF